MPDVNWTELPPELRSVFEEQQRTINELKTQVQGGRRPSLGRRAASPAELIERARTNDDVKGRNRAAVELANRNADIRAQIAAAFAQCEGVEVDPDAFKLDKRFIQTALRLYNLRDTQRAAQKYLRRKKGKAGESRERELVDA